MSIKVLFSSLLSVVVHSCTDPGLYDASNWIGSYMDQWTFDSANCEITSYADGSYTHTVRAPNYQYNNFEVNLKVKFEKDASSWFGGFIFRRQDAAYQFYEFVWIDGGSNIRVAFVKRDTSTQSVLPPYYVTTTVPLSYGVFYDTRVVVNGTKGWMYINGNVYLQVNELYDFGNDEIGYIGLWADYNTTFKDIDIMNIDSSPSSMPTFSPTDSVTKNVDSETIWYNACDSWTGWNADPYLTTLGGGSLAYNGFWCGGTWTWNSLDVRNYHSIQFQFTSAAYYPGTCDVLYSVGSGEMQTLANLQRTEAYNAGYSTTWSNVIKNLGDDANNATEISIQFIDNVESSGCRIDELYLYGIPYTPSPTTNNIKTSMDETVLESTMNVDILMIESTTDEEYDGDNAGDEGNVISASCITFVMSLIISIMIN